jgi:hypothetical protein
MLMFFLVWRKVVTVLMLMLSSLSLAFSPDNSDLAQLDSVLLQFDKTLNDEGQQVSDEWRTFEFKANFVRELLDNSNASQAEQAEALRLLNLELRAYVSVPYANGLSQCRMVPVGERFCGGPDYYLPFSVVKTTENQVFSMVQRYTELKRRFNQNHQLTGTCEVIAAPKLVYLGRQCIGLPFVTE